MAEELTGNDILAYEPRLQDKVIGQAAEDISSLAPADGLRESVALAVREKYTALESGEDIKKANSLVRQFADRRTLHPVVITSAVQAVVNFEDHEPTAFEALVELADVGEVASDPIIAKQETDAVGRYAFEADRVGIGKIEVQELARALEIPSNIRGIELLTTLSDILETNTLTPKQLLELGVIDAAQYQATMEYLDELVAFEAEKGLREDDDDEEVTLTAPDIAYDDDTDDEGWEKRESPDENEEDELEMLF